jgi:hypothetical protein
MKAKFEINGYRGLPFSLPLIKNSDVKTYGEKCNPLALLIIILVIT